MHGGEATPQGVVAALSKFRRRSIPERSVRSEVIRQRGRRSASPSIARSFKSGRSADDSVRGNLFASPPL
eukprot:198588-Hanusia_phi.AAC.1